MFSDHVPHHTYTKSEVSETIFNFQCNCCIRWCDPEPGLLHPVIKMGEAKRRRWNTIFLPLFPVLSLMGVRLLLTALPG